MLKEKLKTEISEKSMSVNEFEVILNGGHYELINKFFLMADIVDYRILNGCSALHLNISEKSIKKEFSQNILKAIFNARYISDDVIMISSDNSLLRKSLKFNRESEIFELMFNGRIVKTFEKISDLANFL